MLIERLEISNFRSLQTVNIGFGEIASNEDRTLLAVLGRNGAGKSSILYALDAFYDIGAKIGRDDCYNRNIGDEIVIRVTYGSLRAEERAEFAPYIEDGKLIVTKRIQVTEGGCVQKYFAAARQVPPFAELRRAGKRDRVNGFKALVESGDLPGLEGSPRSADQADELMELYEDAHPEMLRTVEREEQFFGPKQVGGGKLDKFTKFVLVPAVRDASTEEQRKGAIHELINMIVLRQVNRRPDVRQLRDEMKERIAETFSKENLTELGTLGESISELLKQYAPGAALRLTWGEPAIPEIPLPQAIADLVEDDFPCPISHSGHGLQRSLVLTLLQYLALTVRETDEPLEQESEAANGEGAGILDPDLILAIEEPELFLHPSRCRYLSELFLSLSKLPASPTVPRNQIVYVTHSPYFVDLHRFDQVRIARKNRVGEHEAPACAVSQYSLSEAAAALAAIADRNPEDFTRDSFRARSLPVMTVAVNEGFFANAVVVVEGLSDVGVIWTVQRHLEKEWAALGIAIVPALGKENIDRPVVIFRGLKLPTYFVFDGDKRYQGQSKRESQVATRNSRYMRLAGEPPVPFPPTGAHSRWAVFEDHLETEVISAVGEDYENLARQAADELRYDSTADLMKNTEGAARLTELIYESGHTIPIVEEIVARVTDLCLTQVV